MYKYCKNMNRRKLYFLILFLMLCTLSVWSQNIVKGVITDKEYQPIVGASVIIREKNDSLDCKGCITNEYGQFTIDKINSGDYLLEVRFIGYINYIKELTVNKPIDIGEIILTEQTLNLDEVIVKGKHSIVKVEGNSIIYKANVIKERYAPTTAYDLLMKVPSVTGDGDAISLMGANNLMVVIDGKTTTMEQEQVFQQLKALAPDKVKNIEIFYNAPAKYHFNGAVINITTTLGSLSEYSVFLDVAAKQTRKTSTDDRASLLWSNKGITSLTSVGYIYNNQWSKTTYQLYPDNTFTNPYRERDAINCLYGNKYHVSEDLTFQFSPDYRLIIDYYGMFNNNNSITNTNIWQQTAQNMKALSKEHTNETLHTAGIQADLKNDWTLGMRYKSYTSPFTQRYISDKETEELILPDNYLQQSYQDVDNVKASIDKAFTFSSTSSLSFGFTHQYNRSNMKITGVEQMTYDCQTENLEAIYVQGNFTAFKRLNVMLGIRGEYIKSTRNNILTDEHTILWNEFALFPTATLGLPVGHSNFLQFQLISQKQYPSFWAISPETTVIDERTIETGNPELKPSRIYDASLMFILHQKWFFILGCTYTPDYFANIPHQDAGTGKTVYRYENYDFSLFNNLSIMHPMSFGNYNGRIALHVLRMQDKIGDFYGSSFNNEKWVWATSLNNTYKIPLGKKWGNLFVEANFRYQAPAIQGIYRLSDTFALDADVRWNPTNRLSVAISLDNILRKATPREFKVITTGQESILNGYNTRTAMLRLTINLGKNKELPENTGVDTSRYGRQ